MAAKGKDAGRADDRVARMFNRADVNRDGAVDFFTADMLSPGRESRQRQIPTADYLDRPPLRLAQIGWMPRDCSICGASSR